MPRKPGHQGRGKTLAERKVVRTAVPDDQGKAGPGGAGGEGKNVKKPISKSFLKKISFHNKLKKNYILAFMFFSLFYFFTKKHCQDNFFFYNF